MERRETGLSPQSWTGASDLSRELQTPAAENPPALPCANCGAPLTGPFCAQCGQHIADFHQSVWRFVADFLDNTFCWDNKLLRTLEPLFRQPGFLTREFMAGRRVRYVHPLRLFLFTSAVCLAVLHFGGPDKRTTVDSRRHGVRSAHAARVKKPAADAEKDKDEEDAQPTASPAALPAEAAAVLAELSAATTPAPPASPAADGSPAASPSPGAAPAHPDDAAAMKTAITQALQQKLGNKDAAQVADWGERVGKQISTDGVDRFSKSVLDGIRQRLSWLTLALLPVFALMLKALYWRKDTYYFLHLVFSLHYHTFLLLFWTAYTWLSMLLANTFLHVLTTLLLLSPAVYLFLSLRRVYGDSVRRTWTKVALLGGMHLLAIVIGLGAIGGFALFAAVR